MMAIKTTKISIRRMKKGVKQGGALPETLFNLVLQHVIRNINKGTLRTAGRQIIAYADNKKKRYP